MEALETLDEDILRLVLRFQLLDLDKEHTSVEVSRAISLAVRMASSEEQLDIALERSLVAPGETERERRFERWLPAAERTKLLDPSNDPEGEHDKAVDGASGGLADDEDDEDEGSGKEACIICDSSAEPKVLLMGCRHWWCAKCLRNCIRIGLRDRTAWPPRCCAPLAEEVISWIQRPGWVQIWRQVREEQETPGGQRLYCPRPLCAEFIPTGPGARAWQVVELGSGMDSGKGSGGQVPSPGAVRCLVCNEEACRGCKRPAHPGRPCRMEDEDEQLMDLMDERGWASCPECNRIVELWDGCNHIRCNCGYNWCFLCGEQWRADHGCPMYGNLHRRQPMRQRRYHFRQGRSESEHRASQHQLPHTPPEGLDPMPMVDRQLPQLPQMLPQPERPPWGMPAVPDMPLPPMPMRQPAAPAMILGRAQLGRGNGAPHNI